MIPYIESHRVMYLSLAWQVPFWKEVYVALITVVCLFACRLVELCMGACIVYSVCMVFCGYGKERKKEGGKGGKGIVEEFVLCMGYHSFLFYVLFLEIVVLWPYLMWNVPAPDKATLVRIRTIQCHASYEYCFHMIPPVCFSLFPSYSFFLLFFLLKLSLHFFLNST